MGDYNRVGKDVVVNNDSKEKSLLDKVKYDDEFKDTEDGKPPVDKWNLVYIILVLHGIGTLMPWNMFITANPYFVDYKLAPALNATDESAGAYRRYFLSFLGFTAQIPNVIFNGANLFFQCGGGGNIPKRIVYSICTTTFIFFITIFLAMADSTEWPSAFFWITMVTVVILNMANGIYQNSVYGVAACLPMKYTNAVVLGSNISGTLTSILSLVSMASAPDPRSAAMFYFSAAILILIIAFDTFIALPLNKFYRYYHERAERKKKLEAMNNDRPPFMEIFKKCWVQDISVFLVFFVTLTCFPAITAGIQPYTNSFIIPDKYFTVVTCFLFFNAFAMLGNITSEFVTRPGPKWVWLPVALRLLFIPFFMLCNFKPDIRAMPILITSDYVYVIFMIVFAWSSGYFSSLTMMYAPRCVEPQHQAIAGMMGAFFLILGIFLGVTFSLPVTMLVEKVG